MTTIPNTKPTRLGFGEYAPEAATLAASRTMFLGAVKRRVPEVLESLEGEPLARYSHVAANIGHYAYREKLLTTAAQPRRTREPLLLWCRRWHLEADWVIEAALDTLRLWESQPDTAALRGDWAYPDASYFTPTTFTTRRFAFMHPGWEPSAGLTTRDKAAENMRAAFEAKLSAYLDRLEGQAAAMGMERAPEKRNPEHFEWLAQYQAGGRSISELARMIPAKKSPERHADRSTVKHAVKQCADLIGLPLRESRPGRPRKTQ